MSSLILKELKEHVGFTFMGAVIAVVLMIAIRGFFPLLLSREVARQLFEFSHPLHVVLSAFVTATVFSNYQNIEHRTIKGYVMVFIIGYIGSVGIATLSDSIIPYWGEMFLGLEHAHPHLGIIEMPIVINFAAFIGIAFSYFFKQTFFPHAGHVFLSTAASLFHILQAHVGSFDVFQSIFIVIFLFIAVWIPCCISDIAFPLLFVKKQ